MSARFFGLGQSLAIEIQHQRNGQVDTLCLNGRLDSDAAMILLKALRPLIRRDSSVTLDLGGVSFSDNIGIAALAESLSLARRHKCELNAVGAKGSVRTALENAVEPTEPKPVPKTILPEKIGAQAYDVVADFVSFLQFLADTAYWALIAPFRRQFPPPGATITQAIRIGMNALPIVALIAFLLGLIMAFQAAYQLRQFGANIFVANLVGIAMVRELGPLMTAIIVAGRSGSAIAAELGTMTVAEEIDALRVMGIEPIRYLVVPRVFAITFTQPALTIFANAVGVFGGFLIALLYLDLSPAAYINQTIMAVKLGDVTMGLAKSLTFAWVIVLTGCHCGLKISGGAVGVGRATTMSVVASIFSIIVVDSIFTTVSTIW
ncbi:MAG: MlaE family lipid ABC transporter permease subunit [Pseudomonadota bacterium]